MITLALSKGRIFDETLPLLRAGGVQVQGEVEHTRKLILPTNQAHVQVVLVRATDVPTYVGQGGADLGVCGLDTLLEYQAAQGDDLYQPLDLGIARCRMSVAVSERFDYARAVRRGARLKVATKYLSTARDFFAAKGVHVDLIKLYGSMELAPLTGLADAIVDLVSTGATLKANGLVEVEHIMDISARLVVNPASLKFKHATLAPLLAALQQAVMDQAGEGRT
ncbi:MAG: ATP phosphoribosyltransferase [Burkholderiaceae bacterium]